MAGKKENIKALFSNSRSRVIILFTIILLLITVVVGVVKFSGASRDHSADASLGGGAGGIQAVPGSMNQTAQYAALQATQNVQQAEEARKLGTSAIPTIIRTHAFGEGVEIIGQKEGEGGADFSALLNESSGLAGQSHTWTETLKNANCSKNSLDKVINQGGAISDLRTVCSCEQLKNAGYKVKDLEPVCTCAELKAAKFDIVQLKEGGFTAGRLRLCGYTACDTKGVGFTAQEMKDAGFSDGELKGAGFSERDIARAGGLPDGISIGDIQKAGSDLNALAQLRASGVTAAAIRRINGSSAATLKAAGFTAKDLKNAGFSAAELKKAGFSPAELQAAGFSARDLLNAGFTSEDLVNAGFSSAEIKAAEAILPFGLTPSDIKKAGCSVEAIKRQRLAGVSASSIRQYAGCKASALMQAGFNKSDLMNAGFTPVEIDAIAPVDNNLVTAAGCDPDKLKVLKARGVTATRIHNLNGCSADALKQAGFSSQEISAAETSDAIRAAGCDPVKLKVLLSQGVTANRIHQLSGCSIDVLKAVGFDAKSLADAGFTPEELLAAGFTADQLVQAGLSPTAVIAAGRTADCSAKSLAAAHQMGVSAAAIKQTLGCSANALNNAGFTATELKNAGFTAVELKNAGFTLNDLKSVGYTAKELAAAGWTGKQLKDAGFTAQQLKDADFSVQQLKDLGYSAQQLKSAGFSVQQLKDGGFSAQQLKDAGFNAKAMKDAGFSAGDLKKAGFNASELKDAGFNAKEMKDVGFNAEELKKAGFNASQLKEADFSTEDLKKAGFNASELKDAGFSAVALKNAGFSMEQIKQARYSNAQMRDAGFSVLAGLDSVAQLPENFSTNSNAPVFSSPTTGAAAIAAANTKRIDEMRSQQEKQAAVQRYQQKIQERGGAMLSAANQLVQEFKVVPQQMYTAGSEKDEDKKSGTSAVNQTVQKGSSKEMVEASESHSSTGTVVIRTGDILFAVIDTSVNSDEPGPILATIVSGRLKGSKLIGSFNLPGKADKMIVTFNTLSIPGAQDTVSITAFAIDPNTARTALSSETDHHYLSRYGSLFASTFLEGFGNAFQSANTTITIGGTGGVTDTTIANGVGRSTLDNAVIGLATLGKAWGQVAAQNMTRPTTVQLYAGTGVGILFTQNLKIN